jgi:hypothetical protein
MNKHFIVIGTAVLLLVVGLSGCNEIGNPFDTEKNKFVGTWTMIEGEAGVSGAMGDFVSTYTFFSDGTVPIEHIGGSFSSEWEVKDGKFVIYVGGDVPGSFTYVYDYSFSDDDTTLTLINSDDEQATYQKQ